MTSRGSRFSDADREDLAARGIPPHEADRQLELLARPRGYSDLVRPCTPGDGLVRLDEARLAAAIHGHESAAGRGAVSTFVPASGAATRMFHELLAALSSGGPLAPGATQAAASAGDAPSRAVVAFVEGLPRFAFHDSLASALAAGGASLDRLREAGPWRPLLEALLEPRGLDYARLPKGLLEFHRDPEPPHGARTAFAEHLEEALLLTRDHSGRCRAHFTVSPEHRGRFVELLASLAPGLERASGARLDVTFSQQQPATDTLAGDPGGGPFRDGSGRLVLRPAGHGALLPNLEATGGDIVFVKNVDNVATGRRRAESLRWARALCGVAAELRSRSEVLRARLADGPDADAEADALAFVREGLGEPEPPAGRSALAAWLDRPLRVCGMVRNTGEPGGGPYWVRDAGGRISRQIVESVQVDPGSPAQQAIVARATHFNPVFFACSLRRADGGAFRLADYVDPSTAMVARKSAGGRELLALERPGLWNGAMADWITVFVEVPLEVFSPVKTVFDLLRPEHQDERG
ncbi:MAG: DUF4301 family protein [Candidatus Eisenbacteria bacterium]|nr:DUF4301 family protein [Candidatus Eisenbacteria bacterium]